MNRVLKNKLRNKKLLSISLSFILLIILIGSIIVISFQIDIASARVYQKENNIDYENKKTIVSESISNCRGTDTRIETTNEDADILLNKASKLSDTGRYEEAIKYYNQALREDPNLAAASYNKGIAFSKLGKYKEAIESYDQALRDVPNHAAAFQNKGNALSLLGKYKEAIESYDQALKVDPKYATAFHNKGNTLSLLGKYEEAIESYDQALKVDPNCDLASKAKRNAQKDLEDSKFTLKSTYSSPDTFAGANQTYSGEGPNEIGDSDYKGKNEITSPKSRITIYDSSGNIKSQYTLGSSNNNNPPVSSDSSITTTIDKPIDTQLLASDKDNDELTASIVSAPYNGILSSINQENGMVIYTPNTGFTGTDIFTFKVNDGKADSNTAQITVAVNQENQPPSAHDKSVTTNMNTPIDITLPASDPDQNDELAAFIVSTPSNGVLSSINQENGMVTYTPNTGFSNTDTFTFRVNDGKADSNSGIIKIAISNGYPDNCNEVLTQITDEYPSDSKPKSDTTTNAKAFMQNMENCDPITSITPTPTTDNNNIVPPSTSIGDVSIGGGSSKGGGLVSGATTPAKGGANTPVINPSNKLDAGTNKGVVGVTDSGTSTQSPTNNMCPPGTKLNKNGDCTSCEDGPLQMYIKGPWKFSYQVLKGQGLVIKDIKAGKEHVYNSISVPHFKIESGGKSKIVRFCPDEDPQYWTYQSTDKKFNSINVDSEKGIDTLHWTFYKHFYEENGVKGTLSINYDIVIRWKETGGPFSDSKCEKGGIECYRFIPKVSYNWNGAGNTKNLDNFTAFYKLDYGSDTGFAPVKDHPIPRVFKDTLGKHPIVTHETSFIAVDKGKEGEYDNIHTAHPDQSVFVPGCRFNVEFDCAHIHWRWSAEADVMIEPSTGNDIRREPLPIGLSFENLAGTPYLVPGQTIVINIVKYNPGEDPDDPSILLNNEQIATAESIVTKVPARYGEDVDQEFTCYNCKLSKTEHSIVWYVASIPNKNRDTFFKHGIFVLDTNPGDVSPKMYTLSFSGEQIDQKSKFEGKTSGTAMLNHDGNVINGKGKVEIKASHEAAEQGKLCEYEFKIKDPDYYQFTGKWKLEPSKTKQNPQGRLVLDLDSEIKFIDLKRGPQSCPKTYSYGYSLLLVCADLVNIDIAKKEGLKNYTFGNCKFKINY